MIYRIALALALIALVVGSLLLGGSRERAPSPLVTREVPREQEGYAARHARLVQTGPDGQPMYTVEADAMQQHPSAGTVELTQVHVTFKDDGGHTWDAVGDQGSLGQTTGQVDLVGHVKIHGLLPGTREQAHLETHRLQVDTQTQLVRSREPVTMRNADSRYVLQSRGLVANLKNGHVELESAVHGTYKPVP